MTRKIHFLLGLLAALVLCHHAQAASPRVAILGDSITYDGRWATSVEAALRSAPEFADAEIVNFGLASETVSGLSEPNHAGGKFPRPSLHERLDRILDAFKPTLVLACYGMNDGIYLPLDPTRFKAYQDGIVKLKTAVEKQGGKIIFITPPLHNADKPADDPNHYDAVLDAYGDWLVSRRADGWQVIDIRPDLKQAVAAEKVRSPQFTFAKDNVHPGDEGHRFIADSITRQLWPLLKLPGSPTLPNDDALAILRHRSELLKLAWLTKTRHIRPGVPAGLPMDQAEAQAQKLLADYQNATARKVSDWKGYERSDFTVAGRAALLVRPKTPAPGNPWIWRTEFFGHEPQADIALLEKGFHLAYDKNPIDTLAPLAKAGVPILAVVGDADKTVPVSENIDIVEKRYQALGGKIQVIRKPGCDHHPHSLPDPAPIVDFVVGCYR